MNKKLDVLFINANCSKDVYQDLSDSYSAIEPPIWAAMLAQHCRTKSFEVELMDCEAVRMDDTTAIYHLKNLKPRLIVFVVYGSQPSASSQNMEGAVRLAEKIKQTYPEIKILFVGGHIAALPRETLEKHPFIDFVCQNEGVYTISNLLKCDLDDDHLIMNVKGLGWRPSDYYEPIDETDFSSSTIVLNEPSPIVAKEDFSRDLPGMAWDLLPMKHYRTSLWHSLPNNAEREPFASLYTSLGCPFRCHFCMINIINRTTGTYSNESNIFRYWEPEFIIQQFDQIASLGIKNVKIADELFVLNANHFMRICEMIIAKGYQFNIWAYSRVDTVKEKYLETLKKAGVNWLALGIESANKKIRTEVIKGQYEDVDIRDIVKKIRDHGINVIANYIFGLPEDNYETMQETLDLALEMNTEEANFYSAMAYPGSPLYGQAVKEGLKLPDRYVGYSQHSYYTQNLPTKYLTAAQVLKFRDDAWMQYHTSEKYLKLVLDKFGQKAYNDTIQSTKIKLKRQLLEV